MTRLSISDRVSLMLLGWQSECAQLATTNLVHAYSPPESFEDLPLSLEACVEFGRRELRKHLAAVRGTAEPMGGSTVNAPFSTASDHASLDVQTFKCERGCGALLTSAGECATCAINSERAKEMLERLDELAEGWRLALRNTDRGWELEVVSKRRDAGFSQHRYIGTELPRVVARAHAGQPGDE